MSSNNRILYIGGFELPDKNAAAQRVIGIAKGLRDLGYAVVFLNLVKENKLNHVEEKSYFGFECFEYQKEASFDYLFTAKTCISFIEKINPRAIFAYNYPAFALEQIRKYCLKHSIKCFADATEWYQPKRKNVVSRLVKTIDTAYRMRIVQKRLNGVIAISRYLYEYYTSKTRTVLIPPTVDITDDKWAIQTENHQEEKSKSFIYAGSPDAYKERLDTIVSTFGHINDSSHIAAVLNIIGITKDQFVGMYNWSGPIPENVRFFERIDHKRVIEMLKQSDWSIIIRDNNLVVKAGFPTKLVESISCGTPVVINEFSNVTDYLDEKNSIIVSNVDSLRDAVIEACTKKCDISNMVFDYHNYLHELRSLLKEENNIY